MLNHILSVIGIKVESQTSRRTTYRSPFNPQEKTPSFFTFAGANGVNWKDYSTGQGGDIYKFVMMYFNLSFPDAKRKIEELSGVSPNVTALDSQTVTQPGTKDFSFKQPKSYEIKKVQELQNMALVNYLTDRGINKDIAINANVREVYYSLNDKSYFALAFFNDTEGMEVRNAYFKANLINKSVTTVIAGSKSLKVFEGFIDYLSYLQIAQNHEISDYLILNSVALIKSISSSFWGGYELLELYLDNDKAGDNAVLEITQIIKSNTDRNDGVKIIDKRRHYKKYKDLNEYLLGKAKG